MLPVFFAELPVFSPLVALLLEMASAPLSVGDVPFAHEPSPIVVRHPEYRSRHEPPFNDPPRSVVYLCPVPAITTRAPPVTVVKKHVEFQSRDKVHPVIGHQYNLRRFRDDDGR